MSEDTGRLRATLQIGDTDALHVHAVRAVETLSSPFRIEIDFSGSTMDPTAARGASARLTLEHPRAGTRHFSGVVQRFSAGVTREAQGRHRAVLVPNHSLLDYRHGFRIFQELTTPDIVKKVLENAGLATDTFDLAGLSDSYAERVYTVQYDESEWSFISRLLEEEGIHYAFVHSEEGHVFTLRDSSADSPKAEPESLPYDEHASVADQEPRLWGWESESRTTVTKVALNDYDGLRPSAPMLAKTEVSDAGSGTRELYEYPGGFKDRSEGAALAEKRLEAERVARKRFRASTNVLSVQAGTLLEVQGHPTADGTYLVVAVETDARLDSDGGKKPLTEAGEAGHFARLTLIPKDVPFRPARVTPKPRIAGVQTARITGAKGEEIHCDAHGRVKAQFHWDRDGAFDDKTSCWIRTAQAHTTGSVMLPRVGWESLVEFAGGDPDRPFVLGRLYNPEFMPPLDLPAQRTVSGHQSHSSPGGGGMNAVKFDDAAGSERLDIIAQRDMVLAVANNQKLKTTKNEKRVIGKNQEVKVISNETMTVGNTGTLTVGKTHDIKVGANRTVKVDGGISQSVKGALTIDVGASQSMQVGNPASAVLEVIAAAAIAAAQGVAAAAAERVGAAQRAPVQPAINAARGALGNAMLPGPAGALLSGNPSLAMTTLMSPRGMPEMPGGAGALGAPDAGRNRDGASGQRPTGGAAAPEAEGGFPPEIPEAALDPLKAASDQAGAAAASVASDALSALGLPTPPASSGGAAANGAGAGGGGAGGGAGGGGGGGGGAGGGGGGGSSGNGTWGVTVQDNVKEQIGGVALINSIKPISLAVGGASKELIGAARVEVIRGSKSEITGASKIETVVGAYILDAKEGISIDAAAAIGITLAGARRVKVGKTHAVSADALAAISASKMKLTASESITLKCGQAEVVIDSSGVSIKGTEVTVKGSSKLKLDPPAIGPG